MSEAARFAASLRRGLAVLCLGVLRAASVVLRRYSAGVLTFRTAAHLRRGVTDTLVDVPLEHTDVTIRVDGPVAHATVTQRFKNPYAKKIEAVYLFPLASLLVHFELGFEIMPGTGGAKLSPPQDPYAQEPLADTAGA